MNSWTSSDCGIRDTEAQHSGKKEIHVSLKTTKTGRSIEVMDAKTASTSGVS